MILAVAGGALALLLEAWGERSASVLFSLAGLVLGGLYAVWAATGEPLEAAAGSGGAFSMLAAICLLLGAIALTASMRTLTKTPDGPRVAALAAFASASAALLSVSLDLGMLFLSVEALSLCGYGLVALAGTHRAREAAMKWFVQGSVATMLFIVGIGVLLSRTGGSLSYSALRLAASAPAASGPLAAGVVLVLAALAFKAGAFPFHSWMPDALETAPPAAAAVLASAGKVGPVAAAVWLAWSAAGATGDRVIGVVALLSATSIVFGNLAALRQRSLARMLGYSAIAQIGYALAAVPLARSSAAAVVFVGLYALTSVASFIFIVAMGEAEPGWDGSVARLAGLSRRNPALAASLAVIMLSLTGIPLTAGFWGKFLVFGSAATEGYLWLALVGVVGSVVSFGYYGGVLRAAFLDEEAQGEPEEMAAAAPVVPPVVPPVTASSATTVPIRGLATPATVALAAVIVVFGVFPLIAGLASFGP